MSLKRYEAGSTEPWTAELIVALADAIGAADILELGAFEGLTTRELLVGTEADVTAVELDKDRYDNLVIEFDEQLKTGRLRLQHADALEFLRTTDDTYDLIFIDDGHEYEHVEAEVQTIFERQLVRPDGLILLHDVFGPFGLGEIVARFGGYCLRLPKLHVAGGLGIIQVYE